MIRDKAGISVILILIEKIIKKKKKGEPNPHELIDLCAKGVAVIME